VDGEFIFLMPILRLFLGALIAIFALVTGLFTAAVVTVVAIIAYLVLWMRQKSGFATPPLRPRANRPSRAPAGDFIDVDASDVKTSTEPNRRLD